MYLNYSESLWMTRLCLLGERGANLCSLLPLPLSPLHVCTMETGVGCCSGIGLWLLLSSSSTSSTPSTECSSPVAGSVSAKAQDTLCRGICPLSDGTPSTLEHEASCPLAGYRLSAAEAVPSVHLPFLTSWLDSRRPTFPCSLRHQSPRHWQYHNSMTAGFPFPGYLKPLTVH